MKLVLIGLSISILISGCGTIRRMAVDTAAPLFIEATPGLEAEGNWDSFRAGIPGNLKLIDGLLAVRPENKDLLVAAIKGYAAYSFAVHETLALKDKLADKEESVSKDQAIATYTKAIDYGMRFLKINDVEYMMLKKAVGSGKGVYGVLEENLGDSEVELEGVLFLAQSLGSLINLQRDNITLVAELPVVKGMFDWVCEKDPEISNGVCPIFYGSYESGRPKMLGGNPAKGKRIFLNYIRKNPDNWLARVAFLEHYIIPMSDEMLYKKQKKVLIKLTRLHNENLNWSPNRKTNNTFKNKRLRIYQAMAIKRFNIIRKFESDIF